MIQSFIFKNVFLDYMIKPILPFMRYEPANWTMPTLIQITHLLYGS